MGAVRWIARLCGIPVLLLTGAAFVAATYVHSARFIEIGFRFDFDLRVNRLAPRGVAIGERLLGLEGRPPFRNAGEADHVLQQLEPGRIYGFRFEQSTVPLRV